MLLRFAAADKGSVFAIHFARDTLGPRLGDELYFADKIPAPGLIDAGTKFFLHRFELLLPGLAVGRDLEASCLATNGLGVSGENFSDDVGPRACEPGKRRFGALESPQHTAKEFSGSLHGMAGILTQTVHATNA